MAYDPNFTGIVPPGALSSAGHQSTSRDVATISLSKKELVDIWFLGPLRRMNGDQAFICLSVCLFLYEKYLKKTGHIGEGEKFSQGHKVFNQMGSDLGIGVDDAYEFWTCWRNGLAHQGMPKISEKYYWGMTGGQSKMVAIQDNSFTINPWLIRDKILNKVEQKKEIWNDEFAPLMKVFHITNL